MISISTAWNYKPDISMKEMLSQIKSVGIDSIELGYRITTKQLEELLPLLKDMNMKVTSVHNFCPVPNDEISPRHPSNHYRLSSIDEHERQKAVEWTQRAIDTACRASCSVVVIHAGTIDMQDDPTELLRSYKAANTAPLDFIKARDKILRDRESHKTSYLNAVTRSLDAVIAYARKKNIKVGLETRYYPTEIPNFQEIEFFLSRYDASVMGYWHDVGHAEVNVRLGVVKNHQDYFERYGSRLIGVHLHGVLGLKDHQAPFTGDFDLVPLLAYFKDSRIIKVIESHSSARTEELQSAVRKFQNIA